MQGEKPLSLYDVEMDAPIELSYPGQFNQKRIDYSFPSDETRLVVFVSSTISDIHALDVMVWTGFGTKPELRSHGKTTLDSAIAVDQIYMSRDQTSAAIVLEDRTIQRVDFGLKIAFPDAATVNNDYPYSSSTIFINATEGAFLNYGHVKEQLQVIKLAPQKISVRRLHLAWTPCNNPELLSAVLSSDLRLLVVNVNVFNISEPDDLLALRPFTIQDLPKPLEQRPSAVRDSPWGFIRANLSSCNSYVLYLDEESREARGNYPTSVYLFRIDINARSSKRLDLGLPRDLVSASGSFHPSLRLMVLSYASATDAESSYAKGELPQQVFVIVNLEDFDIKPIDVQFIEERSISW